jgi:hypothetical protein
MALQVDIQTFPQTNEIPNNDKPSSMGLDLSTWEGDCDGDSSSESTRSQHGAFAAPYSGQSSQFRGRSPVAGANRVLAVDEDDDDVDDDYFYPSSDKEEMPSTREPSPEPMYKANPYPCVPNYGQVFMIPREPVPQAKVALLTWPHPAAPQQPIVPRLSLTPLPSGTLYRAAPLPSSSQPSHASQASKAKFEPKTRSKKQEEVAQSKSNSKSKGNGSKKANGKARGEAPGKGDAYSQLSEEQKKALANYIYDFMLENGFTSQDGYLLVDVLADVWKDMGDGSTGGRIAQHRFADLLRVAPEKFELFRKGIRVTNHCGWFARKGEKMVRLITQTSA